MENIELDKPIDKRVRIAIYIILFSLIVFWILVLR